jgi:cellulose synthase/poly-beta-1,6-N-acetylglucosamine synthase-like glycosyltransferase
MGQDRLTWDQSLPPYSIVIPARNEEETLGEVLENVRHFTDDLILVDGHSILSLLPGSTMLG